MSVKQNRYKWNIFSAKSYQLSRAHVLVIRVVHAFVARSPQNICKFACVDINTPNLKYEILFICIGSAFEAESMKRDLSETCYEFFLALANPTRLAILELLRENTRNVGEIANALNQEQSMISHNLKSLERCGFVFSEKMKKERLYSLNRETIEPLFKTFAYHSKKYCSSSQKCLTPRARQNRRIKTASKRLYVNHK